MSTASSVIKPAICPKCHYDLKGLTDIDGHEQTHCPECGLDLKIDLLKYLIPWERNGLRGFSGFVRTLFFVTLHAKRNKFNMALSLSSMKARRFSRYANIALICALMIFYSCSVPLLMKERLEFQSWTTVSMISIGVLLGLSLFFPLLIDSPAWFIRRSSNQRSFRCLCQYQIGPLFLSLLLISAFGSMSCLGHLMPKGETKLGGRATPDYVIYIGYFFSTIFIIIFLSIPLLLLDFYLNQVRLVKLAAESYLHKLFIILSLPLIWLLLAFICLGLIPTLFYLLGVMLISM